MYIYILHVQQTDLFAVYVWSWTVNRLVNINVLFQCHLPLKGLRLKVWSPQHLTVENDDESCP